MVGIIVVWTISPQQTKQNKQGVCHTMALPFTLKSIFKAKEELWKFKYSPCKNIIFKKSSKRNQNP